MASLDASIMMQLETLTKKSFKSEVERKQAVAAVRALLKRLETPWETAFGNCWIHPTMMACIKTSLQLELFSKWLESGEETLSLEQIGRLVPECDFVLLSRIINHLAATHVIQARADNTFCLNDFSEALAGEQIAATQNLWFFVKGPCFLSMPNYLASIGYKNPESTMEGNWKFAHGNSLWDFLANNPQADKELNLTMLAMAANRPSLLDVFPVKDWIEKSDPNLPLFVDVGGGLGQDVRILQNTYPQGQNRIFLQDRRSAIEAAKAELPIIKMEHDFFTEQPIKAAAAYYLHYVLHDWPDNDAMRILEQLKPAMKPGYSKIFIHEVVVGASPSAETTTSDITMMGMVSAYERTDKAWKNVVEGAGLKIAKIWTAPVMAESLIEVVNV